MVKSFEWDLRVTNGGCLFATDLDRRIDKFRAMCGHVSKYYKK